MCKYNEFDDIGPLKFIIRVQKGGNRTTDSPAICSSRHFSNKYKRVLLALLPTVLPEAAISSKNISVSKVYWTCPTHNRTRQYFGWIMALPTMDNRTIFKADPDNWRKISDLDLPSFHRSSTEARKFTFAQAKLEWRFTSFLINTVNTALVSSGRQARAWVLVSLWWFDLGRSADVVLVVWSMHLMHCHSVETEE